MKSQKDHSGWITAALIIIILVGGLALSYLLTTGMLYLIMCAFGQSWFGWKVSFGVWLILILLSSVFTVHTTKE